MDWLGRQWKEVSQRLAEKNVDYTYEITYPVGKVISCGDLRVARVSQTGKNLKFVLLHDRFNK